MVLKTMYKYPPAIVNHPDADVWFPIWQLMHEKNRMFSAVIVGKPGSGKSWAAMAISELLDCTTKSGSRFDISRATFGAHEFADVVHKKEEMRMGNFIIVDDAGVTVYSRDAMVKNVRDITKIFQTIRFLNYGIILTLPSWSMLDKNIRRLVDVYIEMTEPGVFKFMWIRPSAFSQDVFRMYPIRYTSKSHPDGTTMRKEIKVMRMEIDKPSEDLVDAYETKKADFMENLYEEYSKGMVPGKQKFKVAYKYIKDHIDSFLGKDQHGVVKVDWGKVMTNDYLDLDKVTAYKLVHYINREREIGDS